MYSVQYDIWPAGELHINFNNKYSSFPELGCSSVYKPSQPVGIFSPKTVGSMMSEIIVHKFKVLLP